MNTDTRIPIRICSIHEPTRADGSFLDLFNALDKGNVGNAQTDGLSKGKGKHYLPLCGLPCTRSNGKGE